MIEHEWVNLEPIGEVVRRDYLWECARCSARLRSTDRPYPGDKGWMEIRTPHGWYICRINIDCDVEVVARVMRD